MFAHRSGRFKGPAVLASILTLTLALLLLAGCGEGGSTDQLTITGETSTTDDTADADADDLQVIEDWSTTLSEGDVEGAADFFAVPSTTENGPITIDIRSAKDAVAFNESLPCAAEVISAETSGDLTTATFELSDRPGGDCGSGTGGEAATEFKVEDGKIVEWRRVEVPGGGGAPGDPGAGSPV